MAQQLILARADVNAKDGLGRTALYIAELYAERKPRTEIAALLREHGATK